MGLETAAQSVVYDIVMDVRYGPQKKSITRSGLIVFLSNNGKSIKIIENLYDSAVN